MSLSASLYAGITGLGAHGERMSVIGNNLANVNTVGYKSSRMFFEDAISQDISTSQGVGQVGRGVRVGAIYSDYGQGSFETTNEATDMAIGGNGFFVLKSQGDESTYYSRAGNFRFNKDGYLIDPHGYVLQGWAVDQTSTQVGGTVDEKDTSRSVRIKGVPTNIRLDNFQSPPKATSRVSFFTNLDSGEKDNSLDPTDPFFAMAKNWDATKEPPLGESSYAYQTTMKVYDENGSSHNLSVYYDPVTLSNSGGKQVWEYIVTCDPDEDGRVLGGNVQLRNTSAAGLLAMGTITFNSAGEMENTSTFMLQSGAMPDPTNLRALSNWTLPSSFSQNGYPVIDANFLSVSNASFVNSSAVNSSNVLMELDFGLRNPSGNWTNPGYNQASAFTGLSPDGGTMTLLPGFADVEHAALTTTSYSQGSTTIDQGQDGYTAGFLQNLSIDRDGVMTGRYSNGQVLELFVVTLANFNNNSGLRRDGGNLFTETRESGSAITNRPNSAGLGSIASNQLEQSNVDMAQEFVKMITTQRGFQANSKIITTTDSMLGELIMLKR
ncbi:MAG: flagellar hook protein FlgE [Desulfovibrio sp.]|uniref:flagellar hook protein FlgE n=1 Tax=Desulfovibrio sp. 7SRBS1 TaxID=3378064 RepID=UPI003B3CA0CC